MKMAAEWYFRAFTGRIVGPWTAAQLKQLVMLGDIGAETEVKKGLDGRWIIANKVKGLLDTAPPKPTTIKTPPAPWRQPTDDGDNSEAARHCPKPTAWPAHRPPVPAKSNNHDEGEPSPSRMLVLVGIGGLLLVGIVVAVVMSGRSGAKSNREPSAVSDQQQVQIANEQQRRADQERAAKEEKERAAQEEAERKAREAEQQKHESWLNSGKEIGQFVGSEDSRFDGVNYSNGVVFSPLGRYVAAASNSKKFSPLSSRTNPDPDFGDTAIYVWDTQSGEVVRRFAPKPYKPETNIDYRSVDHAFTSVAFSTDERLVAAGRADGSVRVWDVSTGKEVAVLLTPAAKEGNATEKVYSIAFSPAGSYVLATGVAYNGGQVTHPVRLWNVSNRQTATAFTGHSDIVISSAFSPDGRYVVTGSWDRTAIVWDVKSGKEIRLLDAHQKWVTAVAFSPDGSKVLTGSDDQTVRLWDVQSGRQLFSLDLGNAVNSVSFAGGQFALERFPNA
jgi:hypothetical protein